MLFSHNSLHKRRSAHFPDLTITDDNVLDQIIKGTAHDAVRKKFIDTDPDKLTLDAALNMAHILSRPRLSKSYVLISHRLQ